jgi:outer membrane cobalamin receptor
MEKLGLLGLSLLSALGFAEALDPYSLSLAQLLDIKVNTASKKLESIEDAPGVVSVINRADIQRFGANDLHDLLRRVPGIIPHSSILIPDNLVSIRGQHSSVIDRRTLVLIDGRPLRESQSGGAGATFYSAFPVAAIERIEIIRGPGSVLYGSNAFSGVINVITRRDIDDNNAEVYLASHGSQGLDAYSAFKSKDWLVTLAAHGLSSEGWDFKATDMAGVNNTLAMGEDRSGVNLRLEKGGFSLSAFDGRVRQNYLGVDQLWPADFYNRHTYHIDAGYSAKIFGNWTLNADLTHSAHARFNQSSVDVESKNDVAELSLDGDINNKIHTIVGASYTHLSVKSLSQDRSWETVYSQLDYTPTDSVKVTVGAQYNDFGSGSNISTRAALLWKFNQKWGVKLLYGEAYRAPFLSEQFNNISGSLIGNPELHPEIMTNYDLQIYRHAESSRFDLSIFDSQITDAIGFAFLPGGGRTFVNSGRLDFMGFEAEYKYQFSPDLLIEASYSYQTNKDGNGVKERQIDPQQQFKLGVNYQTGRGISLGLFNNYYSEPSEWSDFSAATQVRNKNTGRYSNLSLNLKVPASALFAGTGWKHVDFTLFANNALQSSAVYWPDISRFNVNAWPVLAGRSVSLKLRYQY